jgi:hypothetical protein
MLGPPSGSLGVHLEDVFTLRACFVSDSGDSTPDLFIAVVDDDLLDSDDLLGLGAADSDGSISVSFLGNEFRQDFLQDKRIMEQVGDVPARFELDVAALPGAAASLP